MKLIELLRKLREPHRSSSVRFDDDGITHVPRRGPIQALRWDELDEVGILTTSDGPAADDVFWMLIDRTHTKSCAIPSETPGMDAVLARLQELPGFDNGAVIRAMGCTDDESFVVWRRDR